MIYYNFFGFFVIYLEPLSVVITLATQPESSDSESQTYLGVYLRQHLQLLRLKNMMTFHIKHETIDQHLLPTIVERASWGIKLSMRECTATQCSDVTTCNISRMVTGNFPTYL
jgi:hypothetical protein